MSQCIDIIKNRMCTSLLVCFGFQLFVKITDHFLLSTAHTDLRSFLSEEVNGLTRTKVVALHGNKETWMTTVLMHPCCAYVLLFLVLAVNSWNFMQLHTLSLASHSYMHSCYNKMVASQFINRKWILCYEHNIGETFANISTIYCCCHQGRSVPSGLDIECCINQIVVIKRFNMHK